MKKIIFGLLVSLMLTLAPTATATTATAPNSLISAYNVGYITMEKGLSHNYVDDIYRDRLGYIWIALGGGGLSRYDGSEFINFSTTSADRVLPGNFVVEVTEDRFGRLWAATEGGIALINTSNLLLEDVIDLTGRFDKVINSPVWGVQTDAEGKLWVTTSTEIACAAFDSEGRIKAVATVPLNYTPTAENPIRDINGDGKPWTGLNNAICRLEADFDNGTVMSHPVAACLKFLSGTYISDIIHHGSEIWIGTSRGLMRFNPAENIAKNYVNEAGNPASLSQNFVTTLAITPEKRLIAGTYQGISIYNPISDTFERVFCSESFPTGNINNNFINKIFVDNGRIWVGTEGGGVNRFTPKRLIAKDFGHNFNAPGCSIATPVNSIFVDRDNSLWFGTIEGGLHHADPSLQHFSHYTEAGKVISHKSVSSIARDGNGLLWAGTWGGGADLISTPANGSPSNVRHILQTTDGKHPIEFIGALIWDPVNRLLWIGCSRGLMVYNPDSEEVSEAYPGASSEILGALGSTIDHNGHLWLGTSNGLFDIDLHKYGKSRSADAVRHIKGRLSNPESVANERIACLLTDNDGRVWIGTSGSGLYCRTVDDGGREQFRRYSTAEGLPNDNIVGIVQDKENNIWVSTYSGLASINKDDHIVSYSKSRDLINDRFYWNAYASTADGKLLFGTIDGLLCVSGVKEAHTKDFPIINITHIFVDNNELTGNPDYNDGCFNPSDGVRLHESAHSVSFEFSSMNFDNGTDGSYSYRLKGFDNDWSTLPTGRRFVRYTNLGPGDYTLEIRYVDNGIADEGQTVTSVPVTVAPYFYRRWWFILLSALFLVGIVLGLYQWRIGLVKIKSEQLKVLVAERTAEIEGQKREVERLTTDRISFFTNITHEFRTPVTLILGPIERALKLSYNPQVIEQLHFAERNSRYLLSLVNQLMDFRKLESGKMEVLRTRANLKRFLENIAETFRPLVSDRNIEIRLTAHLPRPILSFDEESLQKVLINLIGNAVKFTPDNGCITIHAALLPKACVNGEEGAIYLSVSDNGIGIPPEDLGRIFDRFYQGTSPMKYPVSGSSGSGIGLYLCRSLVEMNNGHIEVRNNRDRGCTFRVILPITPGDIPEEAKPDIPESRSGQIAAPAVVQSNENSTSILLVEDNDDMRAFIRSILTDRFTISEARNGEEALKVLAKRNIDLIISDLMMPVMDGLELSRRVKGTFEYSHIPFLILTAKNVRESRLESYRIGVDEYILKPFDEEILLARIDNILKSRHRYQSRFAGHLDIESLNICEESRDKKFINQVMKVIADNYRNSYFEIGDMAEALGVSRSLLNKKLQSLAGQPASQLLRLYRLNTARELIIRNRKTRSLNISEIAYEVGFNDSKYFTRCFTRHFGMTPSAMLNDDQSDNDNL